MFKAEFNRLSRPPDAKLSRLIDAIIAERPDLADATFYVPSQGNSAYTLIVGDEVFKAPKDREDVLAFWREFRVQLALTEAAVEGAPPLTCVGRKACFYAVKKIDGMPLDLGFMTAHQQENFFKGLGPTLAQAAKAWKGGRTPHPKDESAMLAKGVRQWRRAGVAKLFFGIDPALAAIMDDYARRFAARRAVLAHGDLHEGNMFVDRSSKGFSALIDWGYAHVTKAPEEEFLRLAGRLQGFEGMVLSAFTGYCETAGGLYKPSDLCASSAFIALGFYARELSADAPAQMRKEIAHVVLDKLKLEMDVFGISAAAAKPIAPSYNTPK